MKNRILAGSVLLGSTGLLLNGVMGGTALANSDGPGSGSKPVVRVEDRTDPVGKYIGNEVQIVGFSCPAGTKQKTYDGVKFPNLPEGMKYNTPPKDLSFATVYGTPTKPGVYKMHFEVVCVNADSSEKTETGEFDWTITGAVDEIPTPMSGGTVVLAASGAAAALLGGGAFLARRRKAGAAA
ncbi:hypothetical protein ACTVZO_43435 [Streptomyces sp. IBSNAI002]|uniref:hypothetical protein n=1 Tax=Streptomyces sp. IBSNAI002 TaxID=3457500 RepID=UPI003FCF86EA